MGDFEWGEMAGENLGDGWFTDWLAYMEMPSASICIGLWLLGRRIMGQQAREYPWIRF